jgi:DNA-3-methyladenine glycosylase II
VPPEPIAVLTRATLLDGVRELAARDPALGAIVARHGAPPLWARPRGFPTLVRIILEQQVSLASAAALHARLLTRVGALTPAAVLALGIAGLQECGLTRQKAAYVVALAGRVESGALPLGALPRLEDAEVESLLVQVPGIGPWTAGVYMLMALRRPDVWPPGDLALHKAMAALRGVASPRAAVTGDEAAALAEAWRPWRAVAARILWHGYLAERAARRDAVPKRAASRRS